MKPRTETVVLQGKSMMREEIRQGEKAEPQQQGKRAQERTIQHEQQAKKKRKQMKMWMRKRMKRKQQPESHWLHRTSPHHTRWRRQEAPDEDEEPWRTKCQKSNPKRKKKKKRTLRRQQQKSLQEAEEAEGVRIEKGRLGSQTRHKNTKRMKMKMRKMTRRPRAAVCS